LDHQLQPSRSTESIDASVRAAAAIGLTSNLDQREPSHIHVPRPSRVRPALVGDQVDRALPLAPGLELQEAA
jgi:hypothetical protein